MTRSVTLSYCKAYGMHRCNHGPIMTKIKRKAKDNETILVKSNDKIVVFVNIRDPFYASHFAFHGS